MLMIGNSFDTHQLLQIEDSGVWGKHRNELRKNGLKPVVSRGN